MNTILICLLMLSIWELAEIHKTSFFDVLWKKIQEAIPVIMIIFIIEGLILILGWIAATIWL